MCFSASASFGSSALLGIIGIAALASVKSSRLKPLAAIPLFFAIQQACEGFMWWAPNFISATGFMVIMYLYLFFAILWWPVWMPYAVYRSELQPNRKKILLGLFVIGCLFDIFALLLSKGIARFSIEENHIQYLINGFDVYLTPLTILYCLATIVPFFISSNWRFWIFGTLLSLALFLSNWWYFNYVTSVWCFFAALLSISILWIVKSEK
jgi:hypothetical protein